VQKGFVDEIIKTNALFINNVGLHKIYAYQANLLQTPFNDDLSFPQRVEYLTVK